MQHFVAMVWDSEDREAHDTATKLKQRFIAASADWETVVDCNGMVVCVQTQRGRSRRHYVLAHQQGVVVGHLFRRGETAHGVVDASLNTAASNEILESGCSALVRNYWGAYVALVRNNQSSRAWILRDCSGLQPCYTTRHGQVMIAFADIGDLQPLRLPPFTLNREYLAAFVCDTELQVRACGLNEVTEVLAGECVALHRSHTNQFPIWTPAEVFRRGLIEDFDEAAALLRETAQLCINSWSAAFEKILIKLSGGLDSAIVLGCLANTRSRATCLNLYASNAFSDEREYARAAANHAGLQLIEERLSTSGPILDASLLDSPPTAKPSVPPILLKLHMDILNRVLRANPADAVWTGQGGDNIFLSVKNDLAAADYRFTHGFRPGFIGAIADAARLANRPYWLVFKATREASRACARWAPESGEGSVGFVAPDALPKHVADYTRHPWMSDLDGLPVGKQAQVFYISQIVNRERPLGRVQLADDHHPLLSQPLIELCLQIPTYTLLKGGRDRNLARAAFGDLLPPAIRVREDKGDITSAVVEAIRRSTPFLLETLLDGILVREGVLQRSVLEPFIAKGGAIRNDHLFPLLGSLAAELWTRGWETARTARAGPVGAGVVVH